MTDPYRTPDAPPGPPPPPRFSPLRPIRRFFVWLGRLAWWFISSDAMGPYEECLDSNGRRATERWPTWFGVWATSQAIYCLFATIDAFLGGLGGHGVATIGSIVLLRGWLRAAMHIDEPESRAWWEARMK